MKRWMLLVAFLGIIGLVLSTTVPAYEGGPVASGGSITGVVKFAGDPPVARKVAVTKDQEVCGKEQVVQDLQVDKASKGLNFAVISLVDIKKGKAMAATSPSLDQKGCFFKPHVVLVPAGGSLDVLNSDGILHNIHTYSQANPAINKAQPKTKPKMTEKFGKPEIIKVACDAHKWMGAWVVVTEHPYYVVTDEKGAFKLEDVPAGTYKIQVWHGTLGKQTKEITVKEKQAVSVSFELAPKK